MKENAFTRVEDPAALKGISQSITGGRVKERIDYWMERFFKFDKGKYSTRSKHLEHGWYIGQAEVCTNFVFRSARFCTGLFERFWDKCSRIGLPDSLSQIFGKRIIRSRTKSTRRLYDNNGCHKPWFQGNSIKLYNKLGYFLRTETTINNPKSLGLRKPVLWLQAHLWFGFGCNERLANCCADVDLRSIAQEEPERFSKSFLGPNGKKVPAVAHRKERQRELLKELIKPKYSVYGFKTITLKEALANHFENSDQIRYELQKLLVRGIVAKKKRKSFYVVTKEGWKWMWVAISSVSYFVNPLTSMAYKKQLNQSLAQPSGVKEAYSLINQGLRRFTQAFALIP